jgi:hypothetical protein
MREKVFPTLAGHRPLQRRKAETLRKWLRELNSWGWPREIAELTQRVNPGNESHFRSQVMDAILIELGYRFWLRSPAR